MADTRKKKRRMKRSVRKTLGALFLASSIAVAAIPVDGLSAAPGSAAYTPNMPDVTLESTDVKVPTVAVGSPVYSTGDGAFQFATYTDLQTGLIYAVILGFNIKAYKNNSTDVVIQPEFTAFKRGAGGNYYPLTKAGTSDNLYYKTTRDEERQKKDALNQPMWNKKTELVDDGSGNLVEKEVDDLTSPVMETVTINEFHQCMGNNGDLWEKLADEQIYFVYTSNVSQEGGLEGVIEGIDLDDGGTKKFKPTSLVENKKRLTAPVGYIGSQYVDEDGVTIKPVTSAANGVFANDRGNTITTLTIESTQFFGIGDYAFSGATALTRFDLGSSSRLASIGKGAFQDCARLSSAIFHDNASLQVLPEGLFKGCIGLTGFRVPGNIKKIGNEAFYGCKSLAYIDFSLATLLNLIGKDAFVNCEMLESVTFPTDFSNNSPTNEFDLGAFAGCNSLSYISTANQQIKFVCDTTDFSSFKAQLANGVGDSFYFEGKTVSDVHTVANKNHIAFKYLDYRDAPGADVYEIVEETMLNYYTKGANKGSEITGDKPVISAMYRVQRNAGESAGRLIYFDGNPDKTAANGNYPVETVDAVIPSKIGPVTIGRIGGEAFRDDDSLETVTIPGTVSTIDDYAFRGCYNLWAVYFDNPKGVENIGTDAFRTQQVQNPLDLLGKDLPDLAFVAPGTVAEPIDSTCKPFQYAMDRDNKINQKDDQQASYITYYSGWPTNLVVRYEIQETDQFGNTTGGCTLINYPTFAGLQKYEEYPYIKKTTTELAVSGPYNNGTNKTEKDSWYNIVHDDGSTTNKDYVWNAYLAGTGWTEGQENLIHAIQSVVIPGGVKYIQGTLLSDNERMDAAKAAAANKDIPKMLTTKDINVIKENTFEDCSNFTVVNIGTLEGQTAIIEKNAFKGCKNLTAFSFNIMADQTAEIGDYAFDGCKKLSTVNLPQGLTSLGKRPFTGCDKLAYVNFNQNPNYICENAIIYGQDSQGTGLHKLIEYLNGRVDAYGNADHIIGKDEVAHVTEIAEEAFSNTSVEKVSFLDSKALVEIPVKAFQYTPALDTVRLPFGLKYLMEDAFSDSNLRWIELPKTVEQVDSSAFKDNDGDGLTLLERLVVECEPDCGAYNFYVINHTRWEEKAPEDYFTVTFKDKLLDVVISEVKDVMIGTDMTLRLPDDEAMKQFWQDNQALYEANNINLDEYEFKGWRCYDGDYKDVRRDITVWAEYDKDPTRLQYTVYFKDSDNMTFLGNPEGYKVNKNELVPDHIVPAHQPPEGYFPDGWSPDIRTTPVTEDGMIFIAQYDNRLTVTYWGYKEGEETESILAEIKVPYGNDGRKYAPEVPTRTGWRFTGEWDRDLSAVTENIVTHAIYEKDSSYYTVYFRDEDNLTPLGDPEGYQVLIGSTVPLTIVPEHLVKEGYYDDGWNPDLSTPVTEDNMVFVAKYDNRLTVTFSGYQDGEMTVLSKEKVPYGGNALILAPKVPERPGYKWTGWDRDVTNVTNNIETCATYEKDSDYYTVYFRAEDNVTPLGDPNGYPVLIGETIPPIVVPQHPEKEGYEPDGWNPSLDTPITSDNMIFLPKYKLADNRPIVRFMGYQDGVLTMLKETRVDYGGNAKVLAPTEVPEREGFRFTGEWEVAEGDLTNVTTNLEARAVYEALSGLFYTVKFIGIDGESPAFPDTPERRFPEGEDASWIKGPEVEGYTFVRWSPAIDNITQDITTFAIYERILPSETTPPDNSTPPPEATTTPPGATTTPPGSTTPPPDNSTPPPGSTTPPPDNSTPPPGSTTTPPDNTAAPSKYYVLTVQNGSGSGSYVAGSQPIIVAADPASGKEFSHWTIDPADTKIASTVLSATVITMPEKDVTVTANYKNKTYTPGSTSPAPGSTNRPGSVSSNGTTVVIDKNGLSNTGVVSATIHGSSDNFTIKVTESSAAAEAVLKALQAEYGSLDNIKYFPMDISLYDATGTKKITDTTGLSITITLPLPDSLITYAGNNKVAGVVNDRLDKLTPKFTTIDKVACVSFTAEHFSPYVIYVQTNNLSAAGTTIDSTPKTGDGIHPKWFLSIGLACMSAVFFLKKDKRVPQKVRTA